MTNERAGLLAKVIEDCGLADDLTLSRAQWQLVVTALRALEAPREAGQPRGIAEDILEHEYRKREGLLYDPPSPSAAQDALKECEYALREAIRTNKIGWIQQSAHEVVCKALSVTSPEPSSWKP